MKRWLKEPLFHFLLIGFAVFGLNAVFASRREGGRGSEREIVVSSGRIQSLEETFRNLWGRSPSAQELQGLVNDYVREEALMREAIALGLDRDDAVVRRRLAQKMEFLSEDAASVMQPSEADLHAFLAAHPQDFAAEPRLTFSQIGLGAEKRADLNPLLSKLNQGQANLEALTSIRMLPVHVDTMERRDVIALFGPEFTAKLETKPLGKWVGPVPSGYGIHLVRMEAREPGHPLPFEAIREALAREWSAAKRQEMKEAQVKDLLARYKVTIEKPIVASGETAEAKR
jgi:parvulin-like peptidyl-prolyl cis-trans isomerase-like protein